MYVDLVIDPVHLPLGITLRDLREGDETALVAAYERNREHLAPWDPARPEDYYTERWQAEDVRRQIATRDAGSTYPVVLTHDGEIVGRSALTAIIRGPLQSAFLGYWVDARFTGGGVASAVAAEMIRLAREDLKLHRLEAGAMLHNTGSRRVLERNGFEYIGIAKRYLRIAGEWQDHALYQRILE